MLAVLNGSSESLTVVLSGAKTSVDCPVKASWLGDGGPADAIVNTNGATAVTVLSGLAGAPPRQVRDLVVNNVDTGAITITVAKKISSTSYTLAAETLQVGDRLRIDESGNVQITDSNGQVKQISTANLVNLAIGASTAGAGTTTSDAGALPAGTAPVYPTTGANGTVGVKISTSDKVTGRVLFIGNGVSNAVLKVYGPTGATINGASADAAFSSVSGKGVIAICLNASSNTWLMF